MDHINAGKNSQIAPISGGSEGMENTSDIPRKKAAFDGATPASEFARHLRDAVTSATGAEPLIIAGEKISLLSVALPVRGMRAKRAALPFAVEERISAPLDEVHIALCRDLGAADTVLAAVLDRTLMAEARNAAVLPATLALPAPSAPDGTTLWAIWCSADRALVRVSDGTGFIVSQDMLPLLWQQAGQPQIISYGDMLPASMPATSHSDTPPPTDARDIAVDLRQGAFAPASGNWGRVLPRIAAILLVGLIGHLIIRAIDTVALTRLADSTRTTAQAALDPVLPGVIVTPEVDPILRRLAPAPETANGSDFLPLLDRVSATFLAAGRDIGFRRMAFADAPARLILLIEAPSLEDLQQAERMLRADGLAVTSGAATASAGVAEAEFVITAGAT